jgi:acyl-CoA dehydrogenase
MLMRMASLVAAARHLCYACAHAIDMSRRGTPEARRVFAARAGLLTPLAKAWATDAATEVASLGIQVHGGAGYIEETGAAQHLRDARIFAIYEGTNGIQAIDLVLRKLRAEDGAAVTAVMAELDTIADVLCVSRHDALRAMHAPLVTAIDQLRAATTAIVEANADGRRRDALAGAGAYLRLFAITLAGGLLAKAAIASAGSPEGRDTFAKAVFFAQTMLTEGPGLRAAAEGAARGLDAGAVAMLAGE